MKHPHIKILFFVILFIFNSALYSQVHDTLSTEQVIQDSMRTSEKLTLKKPVTSVFTESAPKWEIDFTQIFWSVIIFLIGYFIIKYTTILLEKISERFSRFRLVIKRIIPIGRISGWTIIIYFIIAKVIAPPIATLLAFTASAGIAVGFALQDVLKNIFGGIMILFDRPFQAGDKIAIGSHYGEVLSIGLRTVRIVTPDDSIVSIPNAEIVNHSVSNSNSGETNCQVVAEFYLPAHVDIMAVKKIAYECAVTSIYVYLNKPISIIIKNEIQFGISMVKVRLKAYVLDIRYEFKFASDMTESVLKELFAKKIISEEDLTMTKEITRKRRRNYGKQ